MKQITGHFTKMLIALSVLTGSFAAYALPVESQKMMISGPNRLAVEAGLKIARKGGNVVDVAIATELALAVTSPFYASLGGGGLALIKMNGKVVALDFRE